MPIYEYNCQDCKQIFEDWQTNYEERELSCPVCGGKATRLISSTSFVLKGGGWYASGYSGPGGSPAAEGVGGEAAPAAAEATAAPAAQSEAPATPAPQCSKPSCPSAKAG